MAYIAGLSAFGVTPRAALEVDTGEGRLDRIWALIEGCRSSFHDLSRVEMDPKRPATPRFNMPFELGLAVAQGCHKPNRHAFYVFESRAGRIEKSLSDLKEVDVHIHQGTPTGLFREIGNVLRRGESSGRPQPSVDQMRAIYGRLTRTLKDIQKRTGARSAFERQAFIELVVAGVSAARTELHSNRS